MRPDWDTYYLGIAAAVAMRADCTRSKVGAILVCSNNRHRGSGYNATAAGGPSCLAGDCPRGRLSYEEAPHGSAYGGTGTCQALHAEENVILDTRPDERRGGTFYITREPCGSCLRILQGSGVQRIVWPDGEWVQISAANWSRRERVGP